jgi:probable addiction module antidote protein
LANPEVAAHYLNLAMEESSESYLMALKTVAQARQMSKVAKDAGIQRETLYRSLSEQGNPTWDTLRGVYDAVGLEFLTVAKHRSAIGPFGTSVLAVTHRNYPNQWGSANYAVAGSSCCRGNFIFLPDAKSLTNLSLSLGTVTGNSSPSIGASPPQILQYWTETKLRIAT